MCIIQKNPTKCSSETVGTKARRKDDQKHICSECEKELASVHALKRQMQLHTGQFRYFCQKCRKGYNTDHAYRVHMDKHQGTKYQCEFCSKTFTSPQRRDYHTSVHTGNYRFTCNLCEKGFNDKSVYEKHKKTRIISLLN